MKSVVFFLLIMAAMVSGCGWFSKKSDDTAKEKLLKYQESIEQKLDSMRMADYRELMESVNNKTLKDIDSLKHVSDSLETEIEKNLKEIEKNKKKGQRK